MQAYLTLGSEKHLRAAKNAFEMLSAQSFATGGWGPDETLQGPNSDGVFASLTKTHNSFETPCGAYAHFKVTRYLLRVTGESRYGDSMERVMYNTVLGAKALQPDGKAFYYSDYNFKGRKVFSNHLWPCCSGTLPQIATDYRISAYFHDPGALYVNLYLPSSVRWSQGRAQAFLTQQTSYPFDGLVQFDLKISHPTEFALNLRIPAWAEGASISVNGKRLTETVVPGQFASVLRTWKKGDRVELDLPLAKRLEAIDPQHPKTVALLCGPLVLFAIGDAAPEVTSRQLLAAKKMTPQGWQVEAGRIPLKLLPFTAIAGEPYSTYLTVA